MDVPPHADATPASSLDAPVDADDFVPVLVPKRGRQLPPSPAGSILYVCSETEDFRRVARHAHDVEGALTLEVGASYGVCSLILARRARRVVGVDSAEEPLTAARQRCSALPHCAFHRIDSRDEEALRTLLLQCKADAPRRCLFLDIGGDSLLRHCAPLLTFCMRHLEPSMCCVKSRALYNFFARRASATPSVTGGATDSASCLRWGDLQASEWEVAAGAADIVSTCDNRRVRLQAAGAKQFKHPLDYPQKLVPGSDVLRICRFHNFVGSGCIRAGCKFDHAHCYVCGWRGHRAIDGCPVDTDNVSSPHDENTNPGSGSSTGSERSPEAVCHAAALGPVQ